MYSTHEMFFVLVTLLLYSRAPQIWVRAPKKYKIHIVHKAEDVMLFKTRKKVKRIKFREFSANLCPFWPFFLFWWQFIMHKRSLFILDNCMSQKEHDCRCYPVCYICNNNILLHLLDVWYLFHHYWNLFPTTNKRQMCSLLLCHYPMSLLCPNVCLVWMRQTLQVLLLVKML